MENLDKYLGESKQHKKTPWKIGAMESGMVAIDSADGQEVTGFIDPEDASYILNMDQHFCEMAARIAELEVEIKQSSGLLDDALRSIHMLEDKNTELEQLAKEMAEALDSFYPYDSLASLWSGPEPEVVDKALSRYREVCGGEK